MKKFAVAPALFCLALQAFAVDEAVSPPVGGMTVTIAAGTSSAPLTTTFTMPLLDDAAASGRTKGVISSVTSSTASVAGAGWTNGSMVIAGFPYAIRFTSGSAEGLTVSVTANTSDTVTISGADLVQRGVQAGDSYTLIPVETLGSFFGSDTVAGGVNAAAADIVTISASAQFSYYFNTSLGYWVTTSGPTLNRNNVPIPIGSAVSITRKSSEFKIAFVGRVPESRSMFAVGNSGSTYTHTGFPTDVTLGNLAIQEKIDGWRSASSSSTADLLGVNTGTAWFYFFHNGTNWQQTSGPALNRNSVNIPAGAAIRIFRPGVASGVGYFVRNRPYDI